MYSDFMHIVYSVHMTDRHLLYGNAGFEKCICYILLWGESKSQNSKNM